MICKIYKRARERRALFADIAALYLLIRIKKEPQNGAVVHLLAFRMPKNNGKCLARLQK